MGLYEVIGTAPANVTDNTDQVITLATGNRYRIKSMSGEMQASAVAGNRYFEYTFEDADGKIFFRVGNPTVCIVNELGVLTAAEGIPVAGTTSAGGLTNTDVAPLPKDFVVEGGTVIRSKLLEGQDAGDRWGEVNIFGSKLPLVGGL